MAVVDIILINVNIKNKNKKRVLISNVIKKTTQLKLFKEYSNYAKRMKLLKDKIFYILILVQV